MFLDGCYWHGCPDHGTVARSHAAYWAEKIRKNVERDADTDLQLAAHGWTVVRIWEHQPVETAADIVVAAVRGRVT